MSFDALKEVVGKDEVEKVKVLVDVTDLFGRLYVASRKRGSFALEGEIRFVQAASFRCLGESHGLEQ
jgi:hypothetical protein